MKLTIGEIVKAQGIKGEVKIKPFSDDPAHFRSLAVVSVGGVPFKIRSVCVRGGFVYVLFDGVADRNDAEALVGRKIEIDRSQISEPAEGEYFVVDLIGCRVFLSDGENIGLLDNIENFGSADVFTVKSATRTVRFPFLKRLNLRFDAAERTVTIDRGAFAEVCCYED